MCILFKIEGTTNLESPIIVIKETLFCKANSKPKIQALTSATLWVLLKVNYEDLETILFVLSYKIAAYEPSSNSFEYPPSNLIVKESWFKTN